MLTFPTPRILLLLLLAVPNATHDAIQAPGATAATAISIGAAEADKHRIGETPLLRIDSPNASFWAFMGLSLSVKVSPVGEVISVEPPKDLRREMPAEVTAQASALVRALHFEPFVRNGQPVWATFEQQLRVLPPEQKPKKHIPFPAIPDEKTRKSVLITLARTGCFGSCPAYRVQIHGDGRVEYDGSSSVVVTGHHTASISRESVDTLLSLFRTGDFYSLNSDYSASITDCPSYTTSIAIAGHLKSVSDYVGESAGMPEAVTNLEQAIDTAAGTERWIKGNNETADSLAAEHFDFTSPEAVVVLRRVAASKNTEAVKALLTAGVDPLGTPPTVTPEGFPFGDRGFSAPALVSAAGDANLPMMHALLDAGASAGPDSLNRALLAAARSGSPDALHLLLSYGANPDFVDSDGQTMLMMAASSSMPAMVTEALASHPNPNAQDNQGRTALFWAPNPPYRETELEDSSQAGVINLLVAAGADPNLPDKDGETPLTRNIFDKDSVLALIHAGANVNLRSGYRGQTPLESASDLDVAKALLEAGANPNIPDEEGKSAIDNAREENNAEKLQLLLAYRPAPK